jgi:hypothetical protein
MVKRTITRREFLELSALGLSSLFTGLAFRPSETWGNHLPILPAGADPEDHLARIAVTSISVYSQPWDESKILYQRRRDELVHLYYKVVSDKGPDWNPVWYRVWGGYIHSNHLQLVSMHYNPVATSIREGGQVAEITVPTVQPYMNKSKDVWEIAYPIYYKSVHWVVDIVDGPDGTPWYRLKEPWDGRTYDVPAKTVRLIPDEELTPLSPDVPPEKKRIEVSIARQVLTAYEGDKQVLQTKVSTGLDRRVQEGQTPWNTPSGEWRIASKMPSQHMGNGNITSDVEAYELLGVPWVCYFHANGNATHGTYWHTNFGNQMSHGCVNMPTQDALWVFRWSTPTYTIGTREQKGYGTKLIVS